MVLIIVFFYPLNLECLILTLFSSLECVMQVDGMEEELLDELENAFSDDGEFIKSIFYYLIYCLDS